MEIKYLETAYDFIDNGAGELMIVMEKLDGEADDDNAKFIYDGWEKAILVRTNTQYVRVYHIHEHVRDMLDEIKTILVTEMDGDDIDDVYEAEIVINKDESIYR